MISFPTVVDGALGRVTKESCDERLDSWGKKIVARARMEVEVVGRENLVPGQTYLVMSNHQSHYDIPVMFYVMGANLRMITKAELFRVPVWGPAMRESGFIAIDRSNRARAIESLDIAKRSLARGVHIWVRPVPRRRAAHPARRDQGHPRRAGRRRRAFETWREGPRHTVPSRRPQGLFVARREGRARSAR